MQMLLAAGAAGISFMVLDGLWLGLLMKQFYREQLAPVARMADGGIAPIWSAAAVVYVALAAGIALFVLPRATSVAAAAGYGAVFGIVVYAVYDFTNYSTLRNWPFAVTLVDVAWGAVASAASAAVAYAVSR